MTSSSVAAEAAWEHNAKLSAAVAVPAINLDFMIFPQKLGELPFAAYFDSPSKNDPLLDKFNRALTIVARIQRGVTNTPQRRLFQKIGPSEEPVLPGQISARS
jgi:hypothetical protein